MKEDRILFADSLQETLWRLEEVRRGFRTKSQTEVDEALEWMLTRQGLPDSYRGMFAPAEADTNQGLRLLTGERVSSKASIRHILSEEALRTAFLWGLSEAPATKRALERFKVIMETADKCNGRFCCYLCTTAFVRALFVAKPKGWESVLAKSLDMIKKKRTSDGKWHGYPYYYTLLTLSEIDAPQAEAELKHARTRAERLLKRCTGNDRTSLFRRIALEDTLNKT